ncbi:HpcH/HpaI aldolase/citrate lyase family protein [Brevibacterium yomogidense]|uniref:Hydroxymethylglutaryl-CoA lyase n=1 Tax=Brevibacterium yomogidense TaxID=946573 RepID=A0A1X6XDP5_9MICO|nr:CoA ester lyase [Brevibacterium yomogidense]SLM97371.1 Hydroxymethylglutaryl-CoA lyase [Brevibacterium yomogidense]
MSFDIRPAWLFVPGDRPDRFAKAAQRSDVVIVDLEDAVSAGDKDTARQALRDAVRDVPELSPKRTVIRVNAADTEHFSADIELLKELPFEMVMLPKAESAEDAARLAVALPGTGVIALIETPAGAVNAAEIAAAQNVHGLMWGSEDLIAALGGGSSRGAGGSYRAVAMHVRSQTLLAAKAHGKWALDSIWTAIDDIDGLADEALDAVESGFDAKVSIHPKHVPVVRKSFAPTDTQTTWAANVLEAAKGQKGAFTYEGSMIDAPLLAHARSIQARAAAVREA